MTDVVYIDDEIALLRAAQLVLQSCDLSVETFQDASEAIAFVRDNDVGIIFCDFRMPKMTGLDVLRALGGNVPFYLMSGDIQTKEDLQDEAGLTGFLAKPLSFFDVAYIANEALGKSQSES